MHRSRGRTFPTTSVTRFAAIGLFGTLSFVLAADTALAQDTSRAPATSGAQ
jgi:hypothetical protein